MRMAAIAEAALVQLELDDDETSSDEGDMVKTLVFFAAWRLCNSCGDLVLYVDENARTDTQFVCGQCMERAERQLASLMEVDRVRGVGVDEAN
jgi:hypothetical protein